MEVRDIGERSVAKKEKSWGRDYGDRRRRERREEIC